MDKRLVTMREVLFSIVIISVMLVFGFMISSGISNSLMNDYQEYNTALQIDNNKDVFQHGMRTNIGNAFVYGKLKAIDTVSYNEIEGDFSYIKKVKEKYTRHTRTVTKSRTNSKAKPKHIRKQKNIILGIMLAKNQKVLQRLILLVLSFLMIQFIYQMKEK